MQDNQGIPDGLFSDENRRGAGQFWLQTPAIRGELSRLATKVFNYVWKPFGSEIKKWRELGKVIDLDLSSLSDSPYLFQAFDALADLVRTAQNSHRYPWPNPFFKALSQYNYLRGLIKAAKELDGVKQAYSIHILASDKVAYLQGRADEILSKAAVQLSVEQIERLQKASYNITYFDLIDTIGSQEFKRLYEIVLKLEKVNPTKFVTFVGSGPIKDLDLTTRACLVVEDKTCYWHLLYSWAVLMSELKRYKYHIPQIHKEPFRESISNTQKAPPFGPSDFKERNKTQLMGYAFALAIDKAGRKNCDNVEIRNRCASAYGISAIALRNLSKEDQPKNWVDGQIRKKYVQAVAFFVDQYPVG